MTVDGSKRSQFSLDTSAPVALLCGGHCLQQILYFQPLKTTTAKIKVFPKKQKKKKKKESKTLKRDFDIVRTTLEDRGSVV